jgi:hypothetical protein
MQLVAYGAQDVYLTGNPQITFWKVTYRRYTNFAMESIEQTFNGQADFGRRVTCTISRNGDLAFRTYLQVTLPEINQSMSNNIQNNTEVGRTNVYARWLDFIGEQLISQVEVEIGGQRIDRQYGDWMHIWNQLTLTSEQQSGYYQMIGNTTQLTFITDPHFDDVDGPCDSAAPRQVCAPRNALPETTLYVPLQFWYCRNPGLALPLIALQYHEVKINLDIRPIDECLWAVSSLNCDGTLQPRCGENVKVLTAYNQSLVAASLYVDYVFLDTDERRRMAQNPHEYLIEQLQFTGDESVGSSSNKIKLNFNHPVKELIWVVQCDKWVDYCSSLVCCDLLNKILGAQPFNYTDGIDALPNAIHAFGSENALTGPGPTLDHSGLVATQSFITDSGLFAQPGATGGTYTDSSGALLSAAMTAIQDQIDSIKLAPAFSDGLDMSSNDYNQLFNLQLALQTLQNIGGFTSIWGSKGGHGGYGSGGGGGLHNDVNGSQGGFGLPNSVHSQKPFRDNQYLYPNSGVSDAGTFVLTQTSLDMHCWGENPVVTAKLQLNGQDRFSEREGTYFDLVQPYQHHTRNPDTGINVYSFALRPEEHQPSGTCNFSRIDNATLQLVLSNATVEGTNTAKVRVYATNYNVLRIMSGMGGLAYSN